MTVGDLRKAIKDLDDDMDVYIDGDNGSMDLCEAVCASVVYEVKMEENGFFTTVHDAMLEELIDDYGHEPHEKVPVLFIQQ